LEILFLALALLFYTTGVLCSFFGTTRDSARLHRLSAGVLTVAWGFHLGAIVLRGISAGGVPLANTAEFLMVLGWVVLTLHLLVWLRWRVDIAGLVLPPLAELMVIASIGLVPVTSAPEPYSASPWWFVAHTGASTLGLAALGVAFAMSLIFLVQDRALKSKSSFRLLERLPSLETCDRIGQDAILWGFPLLTLGIVTGFVRTMAVYGKLWIGSPKQIFPLVAWALFALLIYSRLARGIRGRKSAYVTIAAFLIGLLTIVGIAR
jgi:ABC-type uncharacterized transport system permease subunit